MGKGDGRDVKLKIDMVRIVRINVIHFELLLLYEIESVE